MRCMNSMRVQKSQASDESLVVSSKAEGLSRKKDLNAQMTGAVTVTLHQLSLSIRQKSEFFQHQIATPATH